MSGTDWYWMDGTPYCPACVECDAPAVDAVDCTRGPCESGSCACCGQSDDDETQEQEDPIRDGWIGKDGRP